MITCGSSRVRPAYTRAGEYRRPSRRAVPMTAAEREAAIAACSVPPSRWPDVALIQAFAVPRTQLMTAEQARAKPGQLCEQPRAATPAAPPTVLVPVSAEASLPVSAPRAASTVRKPKLSDLASSTLSRYRARYGL